jgi:hypothetical protein
VVRFSALVVSAFAGLGAFHLVIGDSDHAALLAVALVSAALVAASVYTLALEAVRR